MADTNKSSTNCERISAISRNFDLNAARNGQDIAEPLCAEAARIGPALLRRQGIRDPQTIVELTDDAALKILRHLRKGRFGAEGIKHPRAVIRKYLHWRLADYWREMGRCNARGRRETAAFGVLSDANGRGAIEAGRSLQQREELRADDLALRSELEALLEQARAKLPDEDRAFFDVVLAQRLDGQVWLNQKGGGSWRSIAVSLGLSPSAHQQVAKRFRRLCVSLGIKDTRAA